MKDIFGDDPDNKTTPRKLRCLTQCGGCRFLRKHAAKGNDQPCELIGFKDASMACDLFDADWSQPTNDISSLARIIINIGHLIDSFIGNQSDKPNKRKEHLIGLLAYSIANATRIGDLTEKVRGTRIGIGHQVYTQVQGKWHSAYVIGISKQGKKDTTDFLTIYSQLSEEEDGYGRWVSLSMPVNSASLKTEQEMEDAGLEFNPEARLAYLNDDIIDEAREAFEIEIGIRKNKSLKPRKTKGKPKKKLVFKVK